MTGAGFETAPTLLLLLHRGADLVQQRPQDDQGKLLSAQAPDDLLTSTRERINQLLAQFSLLEHDAIELIDAIVMEMRHEPEHRGEPFSIVKQHEIHERAGSMLNLPKALRLLRERFPA
jgi:hypothetical protein